MTAEQLLELRERQREAAARSAERVAKENARRAEVRDRAEQLLKTVLDEEQWASWEREKRFELITQSGRRYRIRRGVSHNIELIEDAGVVESLCAHPNTSVYNDDQQFLGNMPAEDVVVAQVLALRTNEEQFRRTANIVRGGSWLAAA